MLLLKKPKSPKLFILSTLAVAGVGLGGLHALAQTAKPASNAIQPAAHAGFSITPIRQAHLPVYAKGSRPIVVAQNSVQPAVSSPSVSSEPANIQLVSNAAAQPKSAFKPDLSLEIFGRGVSDPNEQTRAAGLAARASLNYFYSDAFQAKAAILAIGEAGSSHSLLDKNQPRNGLFLDEAGAEFSPIDLLSLEAGALNQRALQNPFLVDEQPFPAARAKLHLLKKENLRLSVQGQQSVPASASLSTMTSKKEAMPNFGTETLHVDYAKGDSRVSFVGGHYRFAKLPSKVALDSASLGNSVNATVPANARFRHNYEGWTASVFGQTPATHWLIPGIGGTYLLNTKAPRPANFGYSAYLQTGLRVSSAWMVTPKYEWFVNERNSAPAFYNSAMRGHNNRQGYLLEMKVANLEKNLAVKGQYVDSRILELDPIQVNSRYFFLGVELDHVSF